jgi:hypothetical protein
MPSLEEAKQEIADLLTRNASRMLQLMRSWDTDGNGLISKAEFRIAIRDLGLFFPVSYVDSLFEAWDTDGSGHLTHKELVVKARRASFDRGFIPKQAAQIRTPSVNEKHNLYWARRHQTALELHKRAVQSSLEDDRQLRDQAVQSEREARREVLRRKQEQRKQSAAQRQESFWEQRVREEQRQEQLQRAVEEARHQDVVFLPKLPEAAQLAKRTLYKDPLRVKTPERLSAAVEVAALPDVWMGRHVVHWKKAMDSADRPIEERFVMKLRQNVERKRLAPRSVAGRVTFVG